MSPPMKGTTMTTDTSTSTGTGAPGTEPERTNIVKVVFASLIGTAVEWYDFFLYGSAAALVFGTLFFPESEPATATLLAFGTYALGFVARPLGGVVFGHFGDKVGRKKMLVFSLFLMGLATFAIGLLPTYAAIGVAAPLLLLLCRLVQGFAVGGEWGGAVLMAAEHGDDSQRGFWSSWPQAGVALGNLFATGVLWLLAAVQSDAAFESWGWRIPFLLSASSSASACGSASRSRSRRSSPSPSRSWRPRRRPTCRSSRSSASTPRRSSWPWGCGWRRTSPTTSSRSSRSRSSRSTPAPPTTSR